MKKHSPSNDSWKATLSVVAMLLVQLFFFRSSLCAQSLTDALSAESPQKLLLDARERGDIVRGAILFHQGNIACAKCHRPTAESELIGPNLSRLTDDVTNESIIESILYPSKTIAKEYRSRTVLDLDGRIRVGMIEEENDRRVVLIDAQDVTKRIVIAKADIEASTERPQSIMPSGLADQLKDRQQFLDLLRYVLDLRTKGVETDSIRSASATRKELNPALNGLVAFRRHNCGACHKRGEAWGSESPPNAPDLKWSAEHVNTDYMIRFIADPQETKPGTAMPELLSGMDPEQRFEAAEAMVAFLKSVDAKGSFEPALEDAADPEAIQRGHKIFQEVGCVACHAPRDSEGTELVLDGSGPLGGLAEKYSLSSLITFMEDPLAARPHGLMPNMRLTHREATDISAFLLQSHEDETQSSVTQLERNPQLVERGQRLFRKFNCGRCHTTVEAQDSDPAFAIQSELDLRRGCLAEERAGNSPHFDLNNSERTNLLAFIESESLELSNQDRIDASLTYFNCTACHARDGLGGITTDRRVHFQTTNLNLGEQGRIPPPLTGVGAKLKRKWMRDVMVNGRSVRPYMKTRMPQYGEANVGHLIDLFQSADELSPSKFATFTDQKAMRSQGLELVGNKGLNCVACHTYQFKISDTMPAVDLTEMAERLKKDWYYQYMLAPQRFVPGTVMPSFWPNGKAIRPDLKGEPDQQIEAVWQYLLDGRQARAPRGVIREPLEIVVKDEARMLRRSYQGMGKRGIGVGYPGGINLAFDAEQLRLANLWKGRFVDPSGVWYGQGHGRVRALGPSLTLAAGPELDDANDPWVVDEGRPPNHRFHGYTLDGKRRPTFRYSFGSVLVEDYFSEAKSTTSALSLRRRIILKANDAKEGLLFRLLAGSDLEIQLGGKLVTDGRLAIRVLSEQVVQISPFEDAGSASEDSQAVLPLTLPSGTTKLDLEYTWE